MVRADRVGGRTRLGCRFELEDETVRRQVISFVFGDSARWKYFTEAQHAKGISTVHTFLKLIRIGTYGMLRHAAGLTMLGLNRIRSQAKQAYSSSRNKIYGHRPLRLPFPQISEEMGQTTGYAASRPLCNAR